MIYVKKHEDASDKKIKKIKLKMTKIKFPRKGLNPKDRDKRQQNTFTKMSTTQTEINPKTKEF